MADGGASIVELIEAKRDGQELDDASLTRLIEEYTTGSMPDYQMSALLMAIFFNGLSPAELAAWTRAMLDSGDRVDLSHVAVPKVDKHSTGGVGDKVSIPLAPIVAVCGVAVPMMSGRGLGHTGGTLDKLESIPGFTTRVDPDRFIDIVARHNMVMAGQSQTMAPADRKIYALRDATGTVPSIPLIASSIMSKKLAEGLDALVLDVKTGAGAFMRDQGQARLLAETMVGIGASYGVTTRALITAMHEPLGNAVGNANEIRESLEVLRGRGPEDLVEIVLRLGAEMLGVGGVEPDADRAIERLRAAIDDGTALRRFRDVVEEQGGDVAVIDDPERLPVPRDHVVIRSPADGFVHACDARMIGVAAMRLGAGRATAEDVIDHAVGIDLEAKIGDRVETGAPLARIGYNDDARLAAAIPLLEAAWHIGSDRREPTPLIIESI
jgi:pyrimidine-nucleoside phosphorylase